MILAKQVLAPARKNHFGRCFSDTVPKAVNPYTITHVRLTKLWYDTSGSAGANDVCQPMIGLPYSTTSAALR